MKVRVKSTSSAAWKRCGGGVVAVTIFVLALGFRLLYVEKTDVYNPIMKDAREYVSYAVNLTEHGIYSRNLVPEPRPDAYVPPGYPLFLTAILKTSRNFDSAYMKVLTFQALMGAITAVITFAMGLRFLPFWLAAGGGILTAISPHLITVGSYLLTETLFIFLLTAAFLILMLAVNPTNPFLFLCASFVMGLASLVRPSLLLFPIFILPVVFFYWKPSKRWLIAVLLVVGTTAAWAPWSLWSHINVPPEKRKSGLAMSSFVIGMYPDLTHKSPRLKGFPYREDADYSRMTKDLHFALKSLWQRASQDPFTYIRWYTLGKPMMLWSWDILKGQGGVYIYPVRTSLYKTNPVASATLVGMRNLHPVLLLMSLVGFVGLIISMKSGGGDKDRNFIGLLIFSLLIYFTLVHTVLNPLPRYSIPMRPLLYLGALFSLDYFLKCQTLRDLPRIFQTRRSQSS